MSMLWKPDASAEYALKRCQAAFALVLIPSSQLAVRVWALLVAYSTNSATAGVVERGWCFVDVLLQIIQQTSSDSLKNLLTPAHTQQA